jgi:hypothetical protein
VQLHLFWFPYELVHAPGFSVRMLVFKEDPTYKCSVFHDCRFVWFVQSYVMMVFIDPGLGEVRSLSNIHFFTFAVDAVCMM